MSSITIYGYRHHSLKILQNLKWIFIYINKFVNNNKLFYAIAIIKYKINKMCLHIILFLCYRIYRWPNINSKKYIFDCFKNTTYNSTKKSMVSMSLKKMYNLSYLLNYKCSHSLNDSTNKFNRSFDCKKWYTTFSLLLLSFSPSYLEFGHANPALSLNSIFCILLIYTHQPHVIFYYINHLF